MTDGQHTTDRQEYHDPYLSGFIDGVFVAEMAIRTISDKEALLRYIGYLQSDIGIEREHNILYRFGLKPFCVIEKELISKTGGKTNG